MYFKPNVASFLFPDSYSLSHTIMTALSIVYYCTATWWQRE